jgi:hypothetical protein
MIPSVDGNARNLRVLRLPRATYHGHRSRGTHHLYNQTYLLPHEVSLPLMPPFVGVGAIHADGLHVQMLAWPSACIFASTSRRPTGDISTTYTSVSSPRCQPPSCPQAFQALARACRLLLSLDHLDPGVTEGRRDRRRRSPWVTRLKEIVNVWCSAMGAAGLVPPARGRPQPTMCAQRGL